ncbi:hypothetical protein HYALB_00004923 [Hymenoscyphus albidus]|uniref:Cytochrome P450 monooxygenase n=1 Tax=Hymenoscyphus albidus TaxID=595503 RepID=A0A9N9PR58_9HELO|nr:hypothetical protein HYALB_00004923 [Hymenoscyphus albidus]
MLPVKSLEDLSALGLPSILGAIAVSYVIYSLGVALYNITLHPLAKVPGPKLRAAFEFVKHYEAWNGIDIYSVKKLHDQYGPTVRISPDTVSFNNEEAWLAIYGSRQGKKQIPKDAGFYRADNQGNADSLISADDAGHMRMRRAVSHAFSDAAVKGQEPLITHYFDLLIEKLHAKASGPTEGLVNLVHWFNFTTFDIIGDLTFQDSFDALETEEYNHWIANIFNSTKVARIFMIINSYPLIGIPISTLLKHVPQLQQARLKHYQYTEEKTLRRLNASSDRNDFVSYILRHNDEKGMSREEMIQTCNLFILAGSETTATLLSGLTYHLLQNPSTMYKLVKEIREAFPDPKSMTFNSLSQLKYMQACIQEAFRLYPPVPILLPRKTEHDVVINGHSISKNGIQVPSFLETTPRYFLRFPLIAMNNNTNRESQQWSAYHSEANFAESEKFIPERWLDDPRFASDKRGAVQPFSFGTRNCVGQHLALVEMKSILGRLLWHFELSLCEDSLNWTDQKVYFLWEKKPLNVKLTARK